MLNKDIHQLNDYYTRIERSGALTTSAVHYGCWTADRSEDKHVGRAAPQPTLTCNEIQVAVAPRFRTVLRRTIRYEIQGAIAPRFRMVLRRTTEDVTIGDGSRQVVAPYGCEMSRTYLRPMTSCWGHRWGRCSGHRWGQHRWRSARRQRKSASLPRY